jgi:hypothetical protein
MYKKLVRYDQWHFAEVDPVALRRTAAKLRDEIVRKVSESADIYSFYSVTLPILDAAIRGDIVNSLDLDQLHFVTGNYYHDKQEGTLPPEYDAEFQSAVSGFTVTAEALSLEETEDVIIDGVTYAWLEFEEGGDWPDNVKYR